jgi:hypothetical protein
MATIDTLAVNELSFRGKGNEFNKFSRLFKSLQDARDSLASGDYNPVEGQLNLVIVAGEGIMYFSFDLNDFVSISEFNAAGNQANRYIELDGVNDYIEFPNGNNHALDWTKNFTIGVTLVGVQSGSDSKFISLFSNGNNFISLRRGGSNWGLYVTSNGNGYQHGANTWFTPTDFSRFLFAYNATTKRLKWFSGDPSTGTFSQIANLLVQDSVISGNSPNGNLCIGKYHDSSAGSTFDLHYWDGGFNNLIVSDMEFTGPHLTEYFQTGEAFTEMELYGDVTAYAKLGEDTFPNVTDEKGLLTGGYLVNGTADDFKDIPTE